MSIYRNILILLLSADVEVKGKIQFGRNEKNDSLEIILNKIDSAKHYPRTARRRGIEGATLLRFELKPDGSLDGVNIIKSFDSNILDTAAVKAVTQASPFPYLNGLIDINISYQIDK